MLQGRQMLQAERDRSAVKRMGGGRRVGALIGSIVCGLLVQAGIVVPADVACARPALAPASARAPATQPPLSEEARRLDTALARVNRAPRDVDALIEAAAAASATGDEEAAIGFFRRAAVVSPADARVTTGLARALLRSNDPVGALLLYDRAERAAPLAPIAIADRGLAYDLVGDNARAQRAYRQALTLMESPEITRRLALSQAIAGDGRAAEATLRPLLQDQDKAGWRVRAFVFAITGRVDEAITVAKTLLPGDLATAITPYLRYMPRLTRAQQAAAANLGAFPVASAIGRDDPRIARYGGGAGSAAFAGADQALAPTGSPLGRRGITAPPAPTSIPTFALAPVASNGGVGARPPTRSERAAEAAMRTAPPEPPPARRIAGPAVASRDAIPALPPPLAGVRVPQLAIIADRQAGVPPPATPSRPSLADAFGDIGVPDLPATPRAGAVDIVRIGADRAARPTASSSSPSSARTSSPIKPGKADRTPPSHPSRIWVQLGVGRDHQAMAADWRRMARQSTKALAGRQAFVTDNGARDRMLTGPFATEAAARAFVALLDTAGMSGPYVWISPAGQVVEPLDQR